MLIFRVAVSSLLDLESKYNRAIEEKTLLEQEVIQRQELEEECQRLKDDVRGESLDSSRCTAAYSRRQHRDWHSARSAYPGCADTPFLRLRKYVTGAQSIPRSCQRRHTPCSSGRAEGAAPGHHTRTASTYFSARTQQHIVFYPDAVARRQAILNETCRFTEWLVNSGPIDDIPQPCAERCFALTCSQSKQHGLIACSTS